MARSGSASGAEDVRVVALDDEARGIGPGPRPFVVPGALAGEYVRATLVHAGQRARYGRLAQVVTPAKERVPVDCAHFLDCGGCDLLHASLPLQHQFKRGRVAQALGLPLSQVAEVVPSPLAFGYRTLAKLVVGPGVLGSYRPRTHEVVDMRGCSIHAPVVERVVERARVHLAQRQAEELRYVVVRAFDDAHVGVLLVTRSLGSAEAEALGQVLAGDVAVREVLVQENRSEGDAIFGDGPSRRLSGDPAPAVAAFAQINPGAAAQLYQVAARLLAPAGQSVLELYAGSGGLSAVLLAAGAARIDAVEVVPAAVDVAQARGLGPNFSIRCGSAEELPLAPHPLVVVNPPRKGLGPVADRLSALHFTRLVYVSCNPDSLARDLRRLTIAAPDLRIAEVVPVDLFPQTRHVETVVLLQRGTPEGATV